MRERIPAAGAIAAAVALIVVVGGSYFGYRELSGDKCSGQVKLTVAAPPELADDVRTAADAWVAEGASANGVCVGVEVSDTNPVDLAAALAAKHGVALTGVGGASGSTTIPDVWISDSSIWLHRLRAAAPGFTPTDGASVALSPVVLAIPEPIAKGLGWPEKKPGLSALLQQILGGSGLRAGIVEPTRDAAGMAGLLALAAAARQSGGDAQQTQTAALRLLAAGRSAVSEDLTAKFPQATDQASLTSGLSVAALSEEDVIRYNAKKPPVPLAAIYLDPAPLPLDYPYAVMPGTDPDKAAAADSLHKALNAATFRDRLGALGLRSPDGAGGSGFSVPSGGPAKTAAPAAAGKGGAPDTAVVDTALSTWTAVTAPARMLAVFDISGTMRGPVPTAGGATRMEVTKEAARRGLALFGDDWAVGVWVFSTNLGGGRDWREIAPIGPLSSTRAELQQKIAAIQPKQNGDTGLYDTLAAAYETVQDGWQAGRVNSVLMLTDGIGNDDPDGGLSLPALLNRLEELKDPKRPIQVIILGLGDKVSRGDLDQITKTTGGGVLIAKDPAQIGDAFLKGISLRPTGG
ncbi:substrate-binding domain-containing protein [Phytohabitans sp. ZYX-F-186]|uniref:Substrate-binding domain-containing protein n=1 Tax=Phytohabitans maris TaxID=3071409 RepID=A0ABU0ZH54_9ACTN|nr:substrate-binding domain-containing protein [Phytohabitans sp. ZYX-F-186]MDQ7906390.1 substrate-binding domain-containing protein [Phytohabitans sp. ZYX-F-186]